MPGGERLLRESWRGPGCGHCNHTGYHGRIGVYELLEPTADMLNALRREDAVEFLRLSRSAPGYRPMASCALRLAEAGVTSLEEVMRIASEGDVLAPLTPADAGVWLNEAAHG